MRRVPGAETSRTRSVDGAGDAKSDVAGSVNRSPATRRPAVGTVYDPWMDPVLIPWDCADGFFEAYWRRPEAYLDESVRRGVSVWATVGPDAEQRAVRSLRDDLASGRWVERNRDLLDLEAAEIGLRLLVA